jgi:hypothetical protein
MPGIERVTDILGGGRRGPSVWRLIWSPVGHIRPAHLPPGRGSICNVAYNIDIWFAGNGRPTLAER